MAKVRMIILDDNGQVLQSEEHSIHIGGGSFTEIEQAVESYKHEAMKEVTKSLLAEEQKKFIR